MKGATTSDEATYDKVKNRIDGCLPSQSKDIVERVTEANDPVTYNLHPKDRGCGPEPFVLQVITALHERNDVDFGEDKEKSKGMITKLV